MKLKGLSRQLLLEQAAINGAEMAHMDDEIQAAFLNVFAKELSQSAGANMQRRCNATQ